MLITCDITAITAEGLDLVGADIQAILSRAQREAEEKARSF